MSSVTTMNNGSMYVKLLVFKLNVFIQHSHLLNEGHLQIKGHLTYSCAPLNLYYGSKEVFKGTNVGEKSNQLTPSKLWEQMLSKILKKSSP